MVSVKAGVTENVWNEQKILKKSIHLLEEHKMQTKSAVYYSYTANHLCFTTDDVWWKGNGGK